MLSVTPQILLPTVWPTPRSLATTSGISVDVFSSPYLDVSVQAVPLIYLFYSVYDTLKVGFPIRKSPDRSSFAAPRSLSQLITSFVGSWCQGIPLALLLAWSRPSALSKFRKSRSAFATRYLLPCLRLLLSNQNPLRWAFDLFTRVQLIKKSPIIGSLSYVELCRLCFRSFLFSKNCNFYPVTF